MFGAQENIIVCSGFLFVRRPDAYSVTVVAVGGSPTQTLGSQEKENSGERKRKVGGEPAESGLAAHSLPGGGALGGDSGAMHRGPVRYCTAANP